MTVHVEMCVSSINTVSRLHQDSRLQGAFLADFNDTLFYEYEHNMGSLGQSLDAKQVLPPGYQPTKNLILSSKKIITQYDHACRAIASSGKLSSVEVVENNGSWKLTDLLDQRRKNVKCRVNSLLGVKGGTGKGDLLINMSHSTDEDIWMRYAQAEEDGEQRGVGTSSGEGWVEAANRAVRDIQHVVRHLPANI